MRISIFMLGLVLATVSCKKDDDGISGGNGQPASLSDLPEGFKAFDNIFEGQGVGAAVNLGEDVIILFNMDGDRYAWFEDEEIKVVRSLNDDDGPFSTAVISTIGAATLTTQARLYAFDAQGAYYNYANFEPSEVAGGWDNADLLSWNSSSNPTAQWGPDNSIPYARISAMWMLSDAGDDCFGAQEANDVMYMFDGNGDSFTRYSNNAFAFVDGPAPLKFWRAKNNCGGEDGLMPFEQISAGCRYVKPNLIQEIFFSGDGTQFCFYTVSEGVMSEVYDLY